LTLRFSRKNNFFRQSKRRRIRATTLVFAMNSSSHPAAGPSASRSSHAPWVSRVYIVDDHRFFTFALTSLINNEADLTVCGTGFDEAALLADVQRLGPDVIVMDVNLSTGNGFSFASTVRAITPVTPILFVSSLQNPQIQLELRALEPCSFVEKTKDPADIIRSIRQTLTKPRPLPPFLAAPTAPPKS
jgi:DNA-binding NarL/FixJ family response regulator